MTIASLSLLHLPVTQLLLGSLGQSALYQALFAIASHGSGALLHQPVLIRRASGDGYRVSIGYSITAPGRI